MYGFMDEALNLATEGGRFGALRALRERCESLPEFAASYARFEAPAA